MRRAKIEINGDMFAQMLQLPEGIEIYEVSMDDRGNIHAKVCGDDLPDVVIGFETVSIRPGWESTISPDGSEVFTYHWEHLEPRDNA